MAIHRRRRAASAFAALLAVWLSASGLLPAKAEDVWAALRSGNAVALMRHALAPGTTEPANFNLKKCSTQRNLSADGRAQARRVGAWFRQNGITSARVLTSAYCRCRDTAELLGLGQVTMKSWLNALAKDKALAERQTGDLAGFVRSAKGGTPVILVTHKWNIARLTGITPASGETIVVRAGSGGTVQVVGRIAAR